MKTDSEKTGRMLLLNKMSCCEGLKAEQSQFITSYIRKYR